MFFNKYSFERGKDICLLD